MNRRIVSLKVSFLLESFLADTADVLRRLTAFVVEMTF